MRRAMVVRCAVVLLCATAWHGAALAQRAPHGTNGPAIEQSGRGFGGGEGGPPGEGFMPGPPRGMPPGPPPGPHAPPMEALEQLGLTAAQRTKIVALHDAAERKSIRAEADVRLAELDLRELIEADAPDAAAVDQAVDRVGALRTALQKIHIAELLGVRAALTPQQRAKLPRAGPPGGPR